MLKRKVNLVHFPKSAGRSIEFAMQKHFENHVRLNGNSLVVLKGNNNRNSLFLQYIKALYSLIRHKSILITGHYVFTFPFVKNILVVRNPEDVFKSSYSFFKEKNPEKHQGIKHYLQNYNVGVYKGLLNKRWDHVVFYESLEDDFMDLMKTLGLPYNGLPRRNVTRDKQMQVDFYLDDIFAKDIIYYSRLVEIYAI